MIRVRQAVPEGESHQEKIDRLYGRCGCHGDGPEVGLLRVPDAGGGAAGALSDLHTPSIERHVVITLGRHDEIDVPASASLNVAVKIEKKVGGGIR